MRNALILGVTLLVGFALIGCGGGVSAEKATKVYKDYYKLTLDATKNKKEVKGKEFMDKAAKDNNFTDWNDFATKATKALGADGWKKVTEDSQKWYDAEHKKVMEEMKKAATKKAEEAGAKKEGG
ncbi:MAG: hypothetical protein ACYTHM_07260 [Planctomycetota bacterium]|jgi:hypothetical protein